MIAILIEVEDRPEKSVFVRIRTHGFHNGNEKEIDTAGMFRQAFIVTKEYLAKKGGKAVEIEVNNRALTAEELEGLRNNYFKK